MTPRLLDLVAFGADGRVEPSSVRAGVTRVGTMLSVAYVIDDPTGRWRIEAARNGATRTERLWEHTCFEAFLAPSGSSAYWEVNLAAGGAWNVYRFDGYREGMAAEERALPPAVEATSTPSFHMRATMDLRTLPALASTALDVGLTVVLESQDGAHSYWALHHAAARPDFHRRESFTVRLAAEEVA